MSRRWPVAPKLALISALTAFVAVAPNWGNAASASAPAVVNHPQVKKVGPLSGKWAGSYSGSFSGTFAVSWTQMGQKLSGTIKISAFNSVPTSIHGSVHGNAITFGTVGTEAITYSGSFSGSSMSGTWKIQAGGRAMGSGSWSASRS